MSNRSVTIARRYCGPAQSGNGGYSAGLFARAVAAAGSAPLEITLRRPPPLEQSLSIEPAAFATGGAARVTIDDGVIAEVRAATLEGIAPAAPSFAEAQAWSAHFVGHQQHSFPACFVCGTGRAPGDGLRIFPGRLAPAGLVAAPWTPHACVAGADGQVAPEIVWAALDCTGYFGVYQPGTPRALLGRMTAVLSGTVAAGEPCVVIGWPLGGEGRKLLAGTALFGGDGQLVGQSRQVWITI